MSVPRGCVCLVSKRSVTGISRFLGVDGPPGAVAPGSDAHMHGNHVIDEAQARIVDHAQGPLLCLGGPGTGKTSTIVEAVVACARPALVLTCSREAADELRERIAARRETGLLPTVRSFHSLAYSIVKEFGPADAFGRAPRLLGAAEQEQRVRELLTFAVREGRVRWPSELLGALGTRGLSKQVRLLLSRAQLLGLSSTELAKIARRADVAEWEALADFLAEYLDVFDALGVLDYSELMARAVALADDPQIASVLRQRYRAIYVDEYEDVDPSQVKLLAALADHRTMDAASSGSPTSPSSLVVMGDPDQAVFGFRGAEVAEILSFREAFRSADGTPAPVVVLRNSYRFGQHVGQAVGRVIGRVGLSGLPSEIQREHRSPVYARGGKSARSRAGSRTSSVDLVTFDSSAAQAAGIADRILRAKLQGEVQDWADVAVIVRSSSELPTIDYALTGAGIPTSADGGQGALHHNRAVGWLLEVLRVAADPDLLDPATSISIITAAPIALDSLGTRALSRIVRRVLADDDTTAREPIRTLSSDALIWRALADTEVAGEIPRPDSCDDLTARERAGLTAFWTLADVISLARESLANDEPVGQVLWGIWSATDWCTELTQAARAGGQAAAGANRDLDAIISLFDLCEEFGAVSTGSAAALTFVNSVQAQELSGAGGTTRVPHGSGDAVDVLTAHAAKGRQWRQVFVFGAQEGTWPDLRHRPSLLNPERLSVDGIEAVPTVAHLLAQERRLFYLACTRAQEVLVVTAVNAVGGAAHSQTQTESSRFLSELAAAPEVSARHIPGMGSTGLSMASMVAQLRAVVESEADANSLELRKAAADRLNVLAAAGIHVARPDHWWGIRDWTVNTVPVRPADRPLALSGSSWDSIERCSLRWFLEHEVRAQTPRGPATGFGTLVHAVAQAVARGELPADSDQLMVELKKVWDELGYQSSWQSQAELEAARQAVHRFLAWDASRQARSLVGTEVEFERTVDVGSDTVRLRGAVDRLERDEDGALHIIDLKTGRQPSTAAQVAQHRQLSLYQVAASEGAFDSECGGSRQVGGAELVQLRVSAKGTDMPKVQPQGAVDVEAVREALAEVAKQVRNEDFRPNPSNATCRACSFSRICPATSGLGADTISDSEQARR